MPRQLRDGAVLGRIASQLMQCQGNGLHHDPRELHLRAIHLGPLSLPFSGRPQLGFDEVAKRHRPRAAPGKEALYSSQTGDPRRKVISLGVWRQAPSRDCCHDREDVARAVRKVSAAREELASADPALAGVKAMGRAQRARLERKKNY